MQDWFAVLALIPSPRHALLALLVWGVLPLTLLWIAVTDWHARRIANRASIVLLAGFAVLVPVSGMGLEEALMALGCGLVVFLLGFALFALGQMGAGDVKLLGALAPWFGASAATLELIVHLSIVGGALTLGLLALRFTGTGPDPRRASGEEHASNAVPDELPAAVPPLAITLLCAIALAGPGLTLSRTVVGTLGIAGGTAALLTLVALLAMLALGLSALFVMLRMVGHAPALAVADPMEASIPTEGASAAAASSNTLPSRIDTPYGLAIAAAALAGLPTLWSIHTAAL